MGFFVVVFAGCLVLGVGFIGASVFQMIQMFYGLHWARVAVDCYIGVWLIVAALIGVYGVAKIDEMEEKK